MGGWRSWKPGRKWDPSPSSLSRTPSTQSCLCWWLAARWFQATLGNKRRAGISPLSCFHIYCHSIHSMRARSLCPKGFTRYWLMNIESHLLTFEISSFLEAVNIVLSYIIPCQLLPTNMWWEVDVIPCKAVHWFDCQQAEFAGGVLRCADAFTVRKVRTSAGNLWFFKEPLKNGRGPAGCQVDFSLWKVRWQIHDNVIVFVSEHLLSLQMCVQPFG